MKNQNRASRNGSKNDGQIQPKKRQSRGAAKAHPVEEITRADFAGIMRLKEARGTACGFANDLNITARQVCGILNGFMDELFELYQSMPGFTEEWERIAEMQGTVIKLTGHLSALSSGAVTDACGLILDAGGKEALPRPPKGLTAAELILIESLDACAPFALRHGLLRDAVNIALGKRLSDNDWIAFAWRGMEARGLIVFEEGALVTRGWNSGNSAGPLKGGLR